MGSIASERGFASQIVTWLLQAFRHVALTITLGISFSTASIAANERLVVYGDSLSAAYGFDPKDGWVSLLQTKLQADNVTVINASISGETSRGGLSRIKADLVRLKPTIVVLVLGANDGLRGLPVEDTQKNLQSIIDEIHATKAKVVLIGIQIPPNYGIEYAQRFRELYVDLARRNRLAQPPFLLDGFAEKLDWFQADRLHPKKDAQAAILENVLPVIRKAIARPATSRNAPKTP